MKENASQQEAIKHNEGPMLVLAGPGSGKTTVITHRVKALIEECGVAPDKILVITFTRAAAEEMQERFEKLMHGEHPGTGSFGVHFGTFHSVYFRILRYAYNYDASCIIREEDRYQLFRNIIGKLELEIEDEKEFIEGISSEISMVKSERMDLDHYYSINCSEKDFKNIYNSYETAMRRANKIDFDDMLLMCYELLTARPDILALWQRQYSYVLIDEFQDINKVQYDIIKLLALPENNLFIVGDDDQSIYRFRGAKPEIMLNFEKEFPNCRRVLLDYNYRSGEKIVEFAGRLIAANQKRFPKTIHAVRNSVVSPVFREYADVKAQNEEVVKEILSYRKNGGNFSDIAVLYRTNTQPGALVEKLMEYNIPFRMKDSLPNLYDHWISKDIISYIRLAMGETDRSLYFQIMNRPKRYLSREAFQSNTVDLTAVKQYYMQSGKDYVAERIDKLEYDLKLIRKSNPYAAINYIRRAIGYDDYLKEYAEYRRINVEELNDMLAQLQEASREFATFAEWFAHIEEYREELKKQSDIKNQKNRDCVTMMTFHGSKGLEFKRVYIVDANEGVTPHRKAVLEDDMEEERRMFYVAVTRAKDELIVSYTKERYNKKQEPSRFVGEMQVDTAQFRVGSRVRHNTFGNGTVIDARDGKISVQFDRDKMVRTLDVRFCMSSGIVRGIE